MTTIVRKVTPDDYPVVLPMARRFFESSGCAAFTHFNEASFLATLDGLLAGDSTCLIAEVDGAPAGIAAAMAYPLYFNIDHKTGQELFWWVDHAYRGGSAGARLFKALEAWARSTGCHSFSMVALESLKPDQVGASYKRAGYRPTEHSYMKELR